MSHTDKGSFQNEDLSRNGHPELDGPQLYGGQSLGRQVSIQLTPEQFERLYLQPGGYGASRQEDLIKRFGNPTLIGLAGFLLCLTPLACFNLSFRGTNPATSSAALVGHFLFTGGLGMLLGGVLEWIVGNSFSATTFTFYGTFWLGFGYLNWPMQGLQEAFAKSPAELYSALAFWLLTYGIITFMYLIAALRTNVPLLGLFISLVMQYFITAAGYWKLSEGVLVYGEKLVKVGGGFQLSACIFGWYVFFAILLATSNFPVALPLFDLSGFLAPKQRANHAGKHA